MDNGSSLTVERPVAGRGAPPWQLLAVQAAGSVGLAAGGTAGALLIEQVSGHTTLTAVPLGLLVAGSALFAPVVTAVMRRRTRAAGLLLSYGVATAGAWSVVAAAVFGDMILLLAGSFLLGAGNTAVMLGRYVAADTVPGAKVGAAVGAAMTAVTFGAVVGPALLGPAGRLATRLGLPAPAGLYLVAGAIFPVAAAVTLLLYGHRQHTTVAPAPPGTSRRDRAEGRWLPVVVLGSTNLTMVVVMAVMPANLHAHGWSFGVVGLLVAGHIAAMFGPSPLAGWLCDRYGSAVTALCGSAALLLALGLTALAARTGGAAVGVSGLLLLGLGWNLQLIAGTALLVERTPHVDRSRVEGLGEFVMGVAAAIGALGLAAPLIALGGVPLLCAATAVLTAVVGVALLRGIWSVGKKE